MSHSTPERNMPVIPKVQTHDVNTTLPVDRLSTKISVHTSCTTSSFSLNKQNILNKALSSCDRKNHIDVTETDGGMVIKFSAGMFELFQSCVKHLYTNYDQRYVVSHNSDCDQTGLEFRENYKITCDKSNSYTMNLFPTTCTVLVNGSALTTTFMNIDLSRLAEYATESKKCTAVELNQSISDGSKKW